MRSFIMNLKYSLIKNEVDLFFQIRMRLKRFIIVQKFLPLYKKYLKKQSHDINTSPNNVLLEEGYSYIDEVLSLNTAKNKLNIIYAIHNSLPETNNGYSIRSHFIAKSAQKEGIKIYPITRVGFPLDLGNVRNYKDDNFNPIVDTLAYYRMNKNGYRWGQVPIKDYIENYSKMLSQFAKDREATIVHAASNYVNGLAGINAARILNIPSIYEVRGFWEITGASRNPEYKNSDMYNLQQRLENQACRDATSVIALSEIVKEELMRRGIDGNKIYIVPNGVDTEKMKPTEKNIDLLNKLNWNRKFVVGFIGSVVDYEGLKLLVEAAEKLMKSGHDDFRYMIVGDGNDLENLKKLVEEKELSRLFLFMGRIPYEDVNKYYSIMNVACYPRLNWEVCAIVSPKKPFEAMAYGIPVVSSSVRANSYFIEDGVNGLIHKSENSDSIVEKLKLLYEDDKLTQKIGSNGRKWIVENCDSKIAGPKLKEIYQKTINKFIEESKQ